MFGRKTLEFMLICIGDEMRDSLVNVKLKDIDTWAAKNMSTNWVTERTKIFRKAI